MSGFVNMHLCCNRRASYVQADQIVKLYSRKHLSAHGSLALAITLLGLQFLTGPQWKVLVALGESYSLTSSFSLSTVWKVDIVWLA